MSIGENIRKNRIENSITQKELGERLGVSQEMISQYENGSRIPKTETLSKIAEALNIHIDDLTTSKKYWRNANGGLSVKAPHFLTYDWENHQKNMNKRRKQIAKAFSQSDFLSDLMVELHDKFLDMNVQGQEKVIEYVRDIYEFPKYKRTYDVDDVDG